MRERLEKSEDDAWQPHDVRRSWMQRRRYLPHVAFMRRRSNRLRKPLALPMARSISTSPIRQRSCLACSTAQSKPISAGVISRLVGQDPRAFFVAYLRRRLEVLWSNLHVMQAVLPEVLANR